MTGDDMDLLREYARGDSEEAFAALVSRYVNLVYSVALRHVHDAHLAEEITQVVFIILARKAESLSPRTILSGWLCRTARNVSTRALTSRQRRQSREQEAYMQSMTNAPETDAWNRIAPLLDGALAQLGGKDHDAIVLRFFDGKSFRDVGAALGASEDTAKKRVTRALEKLRRLFAKRGITLPAAVIAAAVAANSVQAAPVTLAKSATSAALAKGAAASGSTLTLLKGALKIMAWTKAKTAVVAGVAALLAAGTTTVTIKAIQKHREEAVWEHVTKLDWKQLQTAPQTAAIRLAKPKGPHGFAAGPHNSMVQFHAPATEIFAHAYNTTMVRIANPELLPPGEYDYIVTVPVKPREALQAAARAKFGLAAKMEMRDTDVLVLTVARPDAPGLKAAAQNGQSSWRWKNGWAKLSNEPMAEVALFVEQRLNLPVIDQTGLDGRYDFTINWSNGADDPEALKKAYLDELGLRLTPTNQAIKMLVLEKAK